MPCSEGSVHTLIDILFYNSKTFVYLVTGNIVGYGSDNEPLIRNVKIVQDVTETFWNDLYVNEELRHKKLLERCKYNEQ